MRPIVIPSLLLAAMLALAAIPAVGESVDPLRVTILDVGWYRSRSGLRWRRRGSTTAMPRRFYGRSERGDAAATMLGVTDQGGGFSYGHGDGIVLAASALGLPIQGGAGVAAFAGHEIQRVNLGPVGHMSLLATGAEKILAVLLDRVLDRVETTTEVH